MTNSTDIYNRLGKVETTCSSLNYKYTSLHEDVKEVKEDAKEVKSDVKQILQDVARLNGKNCAMDKQNTFFISLTKHWGKIIITILAIIFSAGGTAYYTMGM